MTDTPVSRWSLAEQAALGSGADFWTTKAVGDLPSITLTDGPHGVRKQASSNDHLGLGGSVPATCFPPAVSLAQSWDPDLIERVGAALGREAQALDVQVLLGPGVNIKRDPRCGRNFEYYSEDPFVSGVLAAAWIRGLQSQGVGASVKHFAANNQERDRMRVSADVDSRALREIYLRAFERVVTEASPWTIMAAYNRINGEWAVQDPWLLTELLRDEWGFDGVVVSDWGAVVDRVRSVAAGLDLDMPGSGGATDAEVVDAVGRGELDQDAARQSAERVAALVERVRERRRPDERPGLDADEHHALAREVAARSIVLLSNEDAILPLPPATPLAVIGELARTVRYQGGGSSHVQPTQLEVPLEELDARATSLTFTPGYTLDDSGDAAALRAEAVEAAGNAPAAVVFVGLAEKDESEGVDRPDIELPADQVELVREVVETQPRTVVVVVHGGVLRLAPLVEHAPAIVDTTLLGQAGGAAIANVLYGEINPSGRLAETIPERLADTPAYLSFPGELGNVLYGEGIFVGYRWYDARELPVTFPFGHGLSYTTFEYEDLSVTASDAGIHASVAVRNTGDRRGREIPQFYVGLADSTVARPPRQLAGFANIDLEPGERQRVEVLLQRNDLQYWDARVDRWVLEGGEYEVSVGASSRDIRASSRVSIAGDSIRMPLTLQSTIAELSADPAAKEQLGDVLAGIFGGATQSDGIMDESALNAMLGEIPVGRLVQFSGGQLTRERLEQLIAAAEAARGTDASAS